MKAKNEFTTPSIFEYSYPQKSATKISIYKYYELYVVSYFYHITVHETLAKMLPLNVGSNNPLCKHEYSRDTFSNKKTLPIYSKEYAS